MEKIPILMTYENWVNSQLSVARFTGGMRINDHFYFLVSDNSNSLEPDLIREDWEPIYRKLGRTKTIGLINNGTSLYVAKQIIKSMNQNKEPLPKLF